MPSSSIAGGADPIHLPGGPGRISGAESAVRHTTGWSPTVPTMTPASLMPTAAAFWPFSRWALPSVTTQATSVSLPNGPTKLMPTATPLVLMSYRCGSVPSIGTTCRTLPSSQMSNRSRPPPGYDRPST